MKQPNKASLDGEKRERKFRSVPLLLLLLLMITSCVVSYMLGRSAAPGPTGQIIDTILLTPQETEARTVAHLTGQVLYGDGTPAAQLQLELHSDPITTMTDEDGYFLFSNVAFGEHEITVFYPDGSTAARQSVTITQGSTEQGVEIFQSEEGCIITVAVNIRTLEITLWLDEQTQSIHLGEYTYSDKSGLVVTPAGTASVDEGAVVSPLGIVYLPDGTIVIPSREGSAAAVILPDDTVIYPQRDITGDGYVIEPDGTVILPDGTEVLPGGPIVTPDGTEHEPDEGGSIVSDGTVTPVGGTPPSGGEASSTEEGDAAPVGGDTSPRVDNTPPTGGGTSTGGDTSPTGGGTSSTGGDTSPTDGDTPSTDGDTSSTGGDTPSTGGGTSSGGSATPSDGELSVYGQTRSGGYTRWQQTSSIDLFYNRTSGEQEKIAPGSSGYYLFELENTRTSGLELTISLTEGSIHLPLNISLTPLDGNGIPLSGQRVSGTLVSGAGLILDGEIAGRASCTYRLDWEWPLEGNDDLDEQIGRGDNLVYLLSMSILAEGL